MEPYRNPQDIARLAARARLAYEVGGLRLSWRAAWPAIPLTAASLGCCGPQWASLALGGLLLVACAGLAFAGGEGGRAVRPGLFAGSLCAALPMAAKLSTLCVLTGCHTMLKLCMLGGLLSGGFLGYRAGLLAPSRPRFLAVAGAIAGLAGSLGCVAAGVAGVAGMALGFVAASMPFLLVARDRA